MKQLYAALTLTALFTQTGFALERVQAGDERLDCPALASEQTTMQGLIDAGSSERTIGQAAAGGATNMGTQIATSQVAGSLFGAFGGIAAKLAGAAAAQTVESKMGPDEAAKAKAEAASARKGFLDQLAKAKRCEAGGAGKVLSAEEFQQIASALPTMSITPMSPDAVASALQTPVIPLATAGVVDGKLDLKGKKVYLADFRVLFEVGGKVSANTRGAYLPGIDYGSTRATVYYTVPKVDVAAFQVITDKAFEDFKARMATSGVDISYSAPEGGSVYDATETASQPGQPIFLDKNLGHTERRYLVMAPTGTKLVSRGFAGIGAGNIGKRIEWGKSNTEGMSVTLAVNIAAQETSGSGSSLIKRSSSAAASSQMSADSGSELLIQTHVNGGLLRIANPVAVPGQFANFRTTKEFDSDKDMTSRMVGTLQNAMGQGANKSKRVDKEVDLDAAAMSKLSLQGLATINQAIADLARSN